MISKGSSETTRVTSNIQNFYIYLGGLIDGNGHFTVSKKVSLDITLYKKDLDVLYFLKKTLGAGIVRQREGQGYIYRLSKTKPLQNLLENLNGNLHTPEKKQAFCVVASFFSIVPKNKILDKKSGWLSGFVDAQGYFSIRGKTNLTLSIFQKNKEILSQIQDCYGLGSIDFDNKCKCYNWCITNTQDIISMIFYFSKFPLKTQKRVDVFKFKRILFFKQRGDHLGCSPHKKNFDRYIALYKNWKKI